MTQYSKNYIYFSPKKLFCIDLRLRKINTLRNVSDFWSNECYDLFKITLNDSNGSLRIILYYTRFYEKNITYINSI